MHCPARRADRSDHLAVGDAVVLVKENIGMSWAITVRAERDQEFARRGLLRGQRREPGADSNEQAKAGCVSWRLTKSRIRNPGSGI